MVAGGKAERVQQGELWLLATECEGDIQGLMAIPLQPRHAQLTPGELLAYVDYLEVSPWNQRSTACPRRFLGVGVAMIAEAIIISIELGFEGRVGLHSLPQAEDFYTSKCGMTRVGPDAGYFDLVYLEYTAETGLAWLEERNRE